MCHNLDNKVKFSLYSTRNIHTGDSKKCIRIRTDIFFRDATQRWRLYSTRQRRQRQCAGQQVCTKRSTPCAGFLLLLRAWPQAATQHVALLKVKLPAFWTKDTGSWFMLTESTFNGSRVVVSRLRFYLAPTCTVRGGYWAGSWWMTWNPPYTWPSKSGSSRSRRRSPWISASSWYIVLSCLCNLPDI